ncbi:hypothetical protein L198_06565 [Cryptococcus wingfieldii CBS 7118]|uniref:F-box domain-containing protein n=1 Tax=Cryptococcus wingfieldii CBS 7118 TaxID=1295528 RepID=A0A1E3IJJ7_9TREE|nr:hypothetical protein L198_06565 [Cryptococcus wingfieldii CBS 7118]ODN88763.1 hypothetical protein L198_06565 [Cryptococcus wingfieldii CBS 7118]
MAAFEVSAAGVPSSTPETAPILLLPPEIIDHFLTLVPPSELQLTALSLLKVFPNHNISRRHLWRHLIVFRAGQLWPLWQVLKQEEMMRRGVSTFCLQSWQGDADILNNVMRRLTHLHTLMLNIGTNFAPGHLEEMFENPRMDLERMELRFRPYVEQASYYQFLAGSYFDTAIETLTKKWPVCPNFTHLSIVQDLPPRSTVPPTARTTAANSAANSGVNSLANSISDLRLEAPSGQSTASPSDSDNEDSTPPTSVDDPNPYDRSRTKAYTGHGPFGNPFLNEKMGITKPKTFAQPIVFFDIRCIATFGGSASAASLTHLRIRVPSRDLARVMTLPPPRGSRSQTLFPELRYLDISTTNVRIDTTFSALLKQYHKLEHLVLDRVNLFGFTAREKGLELCSDLGALLVNAGLARSKEREKQMTAWEVAERVRQAEAAAEAARREAELRAEEEEGEEEQGETDEDRRAREAREEIERNLEANRRRRGPRSMAMSTFSLRDRPRRTVADSSASSSTNSLPLPPQDKLYFVLPPLPTLKSLSIGGEAHTLSADKVQDWEDQFHEGWLEGLERILGWAAHLADKYERAQKKAEEWRVAEQKRLGQSSSSTPAAPTGPGAKGSKSKGKLPAAPKVNIKPPTDIRLFRFPHPSEPYSTEEDVNVRPGPHNLTAGLVEILPASPAGREYLEPYKTAMSDAQLYLDGQAGETARPPCVFCTVPDCEGPARKGAEGEKVDGRGGMNGKHRDGCGHMLGRETWGWNGL